MASNITTDAETFAAEPEPRRGLRVVRRAIVVACMLAATSAGAKPSAAERETARNLMDQADDRFDAKNYAEALKAYQAADAIMGVPSTRWAVAKAQVALGLLVEARDTAIGVSRIPLASQEPAAFTKARAAAEKMVEELEPRIPTLTISVEGLPSGVSPTVSLDEAMLSAEGVGLPLKVNPGKHLLRATAPGFDDVSREVELAEAANTATALTFEKRAPAVTGPTEPKPTTTLADSSETVGGGLSPWVYVGFGVGAAGVVTGAVTGIVHLTQVSKVKDDYCEGGTRCRDGYQEKVDATRPFATVANIAFGVGILGAGVGVTALLLSNSGSGSADARTEAREPTITPVIGLGSAGVRGRF